MARLILFRTECSSEMTKSGASREGLTLHDKVMVIKDLEFSRHDNIFPKMLDYCDGSKSIEEVAKILSLDKSALLFVLNILWQDGILRKIDT